MSNRLDDMPPAHDDTREHLRVEDAGTRVVFHTLTEIPADKGQSKFHHLDVEVLLVPADRFESLCRGKGSRWDGQLMEDGRVLAMRITDRDERQRRVQSQDSPQPWDVEQLRMLRSQILDFFEDRDDVGFLELVAGGNGQCVIRLCKKGETRLPDGFNIRIDMADPMSIDCD